MATADNNHFLRFSWEININKTNIDNKDEVIKNTKKWFNYSKGGSFRKWYGNIEYVVDWENNGYNIRNFADNNGKIRSHNYNLNYNFKKGITWNALTSKKTSFRVINNSLFDNAGSSLFLNDDLEKNYILLLGFLNSKIVTFLLPIINPTYNFQPGTIGNIPIKTNGFINDNLIKINIKFSKEEWYSRETSWNFEQNELIRIKRQDASTMLSTDIEESYDLYQQYWKNKFFQLHKNEEELNRQFIEIYGLQEELTPDVPLKDITILKEETKIENNKLVFNGKEIFAQFMSYAVGCMFGRYSLDKEGLILANAGETLEDYINKVKSEKLKVKNEIELTFVPDDDNIIPILDDEWFEDDIVGRFYDFLKVTFGKENFDKNLRFIEEKLGKNIRKYFVKDFYNDHIKRYKKRPIYWMFSSPKRTFNVLIYMHRYTPDTLNQILNGYLKEYREKLNNHVEHLDHLIETGNSQEQTKAAKEKDKLKIVLFELQEYQRDVLYPLAAERIKIDLDDGVLVNYNKFGKAIKEVKGLNDKKTKDKVKGFDWIDVSLIR